LDIERSEADDLLLASLWEQIWDEVENNLWDVVILTPPCNTFSRARCRALGAPGPPPLRNVMHPWGFPWLTGNNWELIQDHNFLVTQCFKTIHKCIANAVDFLFEHPEDLGVTNLGEHPASVWQLAETKQLVDEFLVITFAIFQCHFGALSPKPTRFMTSLKEANKFPHQGLPKFDSARHYMGPLPSSCSHKFHVQKLIGKQNGKWKTAAAAAYPPGLCKWLAALIVSRMGAQNSESSRSLSHESSDSPQTSLKVQGPPKGAISVSEATSDETKDLEQGAAGETNHRETAEETHHLECKTGSDLHRGQPMEMEWAGRRKPLVDGFGLCSPTLWDPADRGAHIQPEGQEFCKTIFGMVSKFVTEKLGDLRLAAFKLGLGKIETSPFSERDLAAMRKEWASLLPSNSKSLEILERQPFLLGMISQSLEKVADPDYKIFMHGKDSFWTGVPVGYDEPLPRTPEVFPRKEKVRPLDESEYNNLACNYRSAREMSEELERKFREEEALGRMIPTTLAALQAEHPGRTPLVAAMGAIKKPNGDVRPLHDGTHFVQLNNNICFQDQLQYPGPEDAAAMVRLVDDEKVSFFAMSADIKAAHRLVKIREEDWPLLGCRAHDDDKTIWVNTVGTFGVSSASYWWTRLFAGIGRLVAYILGQEKWFQLVYVDDLHLTCLGPRKFLVLWTALALYEILGTPFSYAKFTGGLQVCFVGYLLDYRACRLGITQRRGAWLVSFIDEMFASRGTTYMRRFNEFLGRLGFVSRVLLWLKPFLAPLYTWSAALDRGTVAKCPKLVMLVLKFLQLQLKDCTYMHSCVRPAWLPHEVFRTDAKCAQGKVVLGGHHLQTGQWFSITLTEVEVPYLFKSNGETQWASAELLAVLIALVLFGILEEGSPEHVIPLVLTAGTDNLANQFLLRKGLTTKWPLCIIYMQMTELLMAKNVYVDLRWRPRGENTLADALTNEDFTGVDMSKRLVCGWDDFKFHLITQLWNEREGFLDKEMLRTAARTVNLGQFEKSDW